MNEILEENCWHAGFNKQLLLEGWVARQGSETRKSRGIGKVDGKALGYRDTGVRLRLQVTAVHISISYKT